MPVDVLAAITTVTDHFMKLFEVRRDRRRRLAKEELEPLWTAFTNLHEEYLGSIKDYRHRLRTENLPISQIASDVLHDREATAHLRSRLTTYLWAIPKDSPIHTFARACAGYVDWQFEAVYVDHLSQSARAALSVGLGDLVGATHDELRATATKWLDAMEIELRGTYRPPTNVPLDSIELARLIDTLRTANRDTEQLRRELCLMLLGVVLRQLQRRYEFVAMKYAALHSAASA